MNISSWDVGIKHLAYCILEKDDSNNITILQWDIINLLQTNNYVCTKYNKNKKACTKKAIYYIENDYYCKKHKSDYKIPERDILKQHTKETNNICTYITKSKKKKGDKQCTKIGSIIIADKAYCSIHKKIEIKKLLSQYKLIKLEKTKATTATSYQLCLSLYQKLDTIPELLQVDKVLIENQPSLTNPIMKSIAAYLFGYYIYNGVLKSKTPLTVQYFSPSNKLKVNNGQIEKVKNEKPSKEIIGEKKTKQIKYKMTKELGIKYTKELLTDKVNWLTHLDTYKKKDDLCDAFLQGYYMLSR